MATKTVYLSGSVEYLKKEVAAPFLLSEKSMKKVPFRFDYHFTSLGDTDFSKDNCASMMIDACDVVLAFINHDKLDDDVTIGEIGYASGKGKICYLVHTGKLSYSFIAALPGVTSLFYDDDCDFQVENMPNFLCSLLKVESPIEARLLKNLFRLSDREPWAFIDLCPQFWVDSYRIDFAYPMNRIGIEVDGHEFHKTKEQRSRDAKRDRDLTAAGWKIIRFTGSEIWNDPWGTAQEVADLISQLPDDRKTRQVSRTEN